MLLGIPDKKGQVRELWAVRGLPGNIERRTKGGNFFDVHKFMKLFYKALGLDGFPRFFSKKGPIDSTCY